jgi:drug/metabolite transporter (DMT)-like permease
MQIGLGELLSIGSAATWAVGVILYRQLGARLPPLTLNFLKNSLVFAMVLAAIAVVHGLAPPAFRLDHLLLALASGAIGIAIADTLYLRALNEIGAGRMGVIGNLYSPLVVVMSVLFLGESLGLLQLLGFGLVMAGVGLVAHPAPPEPDAPADAPADAGAAAPAPVAAGATLRAVLLGVLAIALMAVAIVMVKRVLEAQPVLWVTGVRMAGALAGLVLIAALRGELRLLRPPAGGLDWKRLVIAAVVGQFLSMVFWLGGYKYTQASVAAILNETSSVFIVLLAWLWLGETMGPRGLAGVALALAGVACMLAG